MKEVKNVKRKPTQKQSVIVIKKIPQNIEWPLNRMSHMLGNRRNLKFFDMGIYIVVDKESQRLSNKSVTLHS